MVGMMKKNLLTLIIIVYIMGFSSCMLKQPSNLPSKNTPTPGRASPSVTSSTTPVGAMQTPLLKITATKTLIPKVEFSRTPVVPTETLSINKCQKNPVYSNGNQHIQFKGTIAYLIKNESKIYLRDGSTSTVSTLPVVWGPDYYFIGFSPDGSWLVYKIGQSPKLNLISYDGEIKETDFDLKKLDSKHGEGLEYLGWYPKGWINDQIMYSLTGYVPPNDVMVSSADLYQSFFNPFTGKWVDIRSKVPVQGESFVYPSPDETRIISHASVKYPNAVVIWDVSQGKEILIDLGYKMISNYISDERFAPNILKWAPDSSKFAFLSNYNGKVVVRVFSKDGDELDIIPIDQEYEDSIMLQDAFYWSPESRSLLIFTPNFSDLSYSGTLSIYDNGLKKYTLQCGVSMDDSHWGWVSDQYIAYSSPKIGLYLIDVKTGLEIAMADGKFIGWSKKSFKVTGGNK
jgi:hypothetical protein